MRIAHVGQKRHDGRPYATHPSAVRDILAAELNVTDEDALVSALLHDVAEDTRVPLSEIGERFGPRVEEMVRLLSKLPAEPGEPDALMLDRYHTGLRSADPLVRQVKVADRVHNLREMEHASPAIRARYLAETQMLLSDVLAGTPGLEVLQAEYDRQSRAPSGDLGQSG